MSLRGGCGDNKVSKCECGKPCQNYAHGSPKGCLKIHSCHRKICKFAQEVKTTSLKKDIEIANKKLEFNQSELKEFDLNYNYRYIKTRRDDFIKKIKDLKIELKKLNKKNK